MDRARSAIRSVEPARRWHRKRPSPRENGGRGPVGYYLEGWRQDLHRQCLHATLGPAGHVVRPHPPNCLRMSPIRGFGGPEIASRTGLDSRWTGLVGCRDEDPAPSTGGPIGRLRRDPAARPRATRPRSGPGQRIPLAGGRARCGGAGAGLASATSSGSTAPVARARAPRARAARGAPSASSSGIRAEVLAQRLRASSACRGPRPGGRSGIAAPRLEPSDEHLGLAVHARDPVGSPRSSLVEKFPSVQITLGSISSTWRSRYSVAVSISIGSGSRLPGGGT